MEIEYPGIMTIHETCKYLRIPRSSLYKLAQEGKIPCQKVGRHWRFRREAIDRWLENNPNADHFEIEKTQEINHPVRTL